MMTSEEIKRENLRRRFENLLIDTETSAKYHQFRRAALEERVTFAKWATVFGLALTLVTLSIQDPEIKYGLIAGITFVLMLIKLADATFRPDLEAKAHENLYPKFKTLAADIIRAKAEPDELRLAQLDAMAEELRSGERPVYSALYALSWNRVVAEHELEDRSRQVSKLQWALKNIVKYSPEAFGFKKKLTA